MSHREVQNDDNDPQVEQMTSYPTDGERLAALATLLNGARLRELMPPEAADAVLRQAAATLAEEPQPKETEREENKPR